MYELIDRDSREHFIVSQELLDLLLKGRLIGRNVTVRPMLFGEACEYLPLEI